MPGFVCEPAGHPRDQAGTLAEGLLPDLPACDCTSVEGFPNGLILADEVITMGIAQLSNGAVPHDGLRPHADLRSDFPFLGNPHSCGRKRGRLLPVCRSVVPSSGCQYRWFRY